VGLDKCVKGRTEWHFEGFDVFSGLAYVEVVQVVSGYSGSSVWCGCVRVAELCGGSECVKKSGILCCLV